MIRVALILSVAVACSDNGTAPTQVAKTADPAVPRDEPSTYPDYPIVSTPPGNQDAGANDAYGD